MGVGIRRRETCMARACFLPDRRYEKLKRQAMEGMAAANAGPCGLPAPAARVRKAREVLCFSDVSGLRFFEACEGGVDGS